MRTNTNALQEALSRGEYSHELLLLCVAEGRRQRAEYISASARRLGQRLTAWVRGSEPAAPEVAEPRIVAQSNRWSEADPHPAEAAERRAA
jgi:hypothetical protein